MKQFCLLTALLLVALVPSRAGEVKKTVIAVETENSALVFLVQENGQVHTLHYGARVGDPRQFLGAALGTEDYNSVAGLAYPATGGRYIGEPALHVKYADGTHNTELRYSGHSVTSREGCTTTAIGLEDALTGL